MRGSNSNRYNSGFDPDDSKPMHSVGAGCREIRIRTGDGAFRVFYVTKFGDQVYVLHCFTKKSQKTTQKDIDLGAKRDAQAKKHYEEQIGKGSRS